MTTKEDKIKKLGKIRSMIEGFCQTHLTPEYERYALKLLDTLSRKRRIDITKGKEEIWAASIVYVIARLNFLFDREAECVVTADDFSDFFQTKKSTVGNKATLIEKECELYIGIEGYCRPEITDSITFYQTDDGFIVPKSMVVFREASEEEAEEIKQFEEEQRRIQEKKQLERQRKRTETNRKIAEAKKKKREERNSNEGQQLSF